MLKAFACLEMVLAIMLIAIAMWPFSGFCTGMIMAFDCESRAILGVNLFGPLGILMLIGAIWTLKKPSLKPQCVLLLGAGFIGIYWLSHMF
ncbi:MAG: hypothetical protein R3309_13615 [Reinekea sp.]|nr:hypothetical protein [Reinekea sp.]